MERNVAWKQYDETALAELEALAADYIDFISENKTERECATAAIAAAENAGYDSLADCIAAGTPVRIPRERLGEGISQLLLIDADGNPLSERLVWTAPEE